MLSASRSQTTYGRETPVLEVWNELWYAYEGFLDVLDMEAQVGLYPVRFHWVVGHVFLIVNC